MADKHTPVITDDTRILGYRVGERVYTTQQEAEKAIRRGDGDSWIPLYAAHHVAPELIEACDLMLQWFAAEDNHSLMPDFYDRIDLCKRVEIAARVALSKARGETSVSADDFVECQACYGKGFNDVERQVAERKSDVQTFRETCEACDGTGKVNAGGVA